MMLLKRIAKLARNPAVQKLVVWVAPMVLGWVLKKIDEKSEGKTGAKSTPTKKK